jgi:hypothetical protein
MYDDCTNCEQCDCNPNDDELVFHQTFQNGEEAHYYRVITEFEELLEQYGARKVFGDLSTNFIIKITKELSSENS